jgi:hypothetical protein
VIVRTFEVVRCQRCGHVWDDDDPEDEVCACILNYGHRTVEVLSMGATNTPRALCLCGGT